MGLIGKELTRFNGLGLTKMKDHHLQKRNKCFKFGQKEVKDSSAVVSRELLRGWRKFINYRQKGVGRALTKGIRK